jgi:hypothetical protein
MNYRDKFGKRLLVSRREAADMLGINPRTVREYERRGLLSPIRLNCRVIRYRREELERLIDDCSATVPKQGAKAIGGNEYHV